MGVRLLSIAGLLGCAAMLPAQLSLQQALAQQRSAIEARSTLPPAAATESLATTPPRTLTDALTGLAAQAAVIFAGEVTGVQPEGATVAVHFHVETGIRGVKSDSIFTMREWGGLWASGQARYRRGQRMLVLLHAPSAAGLSSPVGGSDGLVPLHGDIVTGQLDLRWLRTRIQRSTLSSPTVAPVRLDAQGSPAGTGMSSPRAFVRGGEEAGETLDCALVLDLLRAAALRKTTLEERR